MHVKGGLHVCSLQLASVFIVERSLICSFFIHSQITISSKATVNLLRLPGPSTKIPNLGFVVAKRDVTLVEAVMLVEASMRMAILGAPSMVVEANMTVATPSMVAGAATPTPGAAATLMPAAAATLTPAAATSLAEASVEATTGTTKNFNRYIFFPK